MNTTTQPGPLEVRLSDQLGLPPERADFEGWANVAGFGERDASGKFWFYRNGGDGMLEAYIAGAGEQRARDARATRDCVSGETLWNACAQAAKVERTKALHDAARWVDEEIGHAVQDGWTVEAVQALMATRDMLKAHADMHATTVEVKA